jgi:hypothetical protein
MREAKDRGSKWLLEHYGDSVLRLAGITGFNRWRPAPTELVHPLESPDSVLEVFFPGREEPDPVIVEIAAYPERRVNDQMARDAMVVLLSRRVLPTLLTIVLHPKGNLRLTGDHEWTCRPGRTRLSLQWQVIELWTLPAEDLLATNDIGLIPLIPLARIDGAPDVMLRRCRQRIDRAPEEEQENLLAVAQVMAQMRYNDAGLLSIFGGTPMFDDSPLVLAAIERASVKITRKTMRENIQQILETRFGDLPPELVEVLNAVADERHLRGLVAEAVRCVSLKDFRARLV